MVRREAALSAFKPMTEPAVTDGTSDEILLSIEFRSGREVEVLVDEPSAAYVLRQYRRSSKRVVVPGLDETAIYAGDTIAAVETDRPVDIEMLSAPADDDGVSADTPEADTPEAEARLLAPFARLTVNGRDHLDSRPSLSQSDLCEIAGVAGDANVTYRGGAGGSHGHLSPGCSVEVADGMVFNVYSTTGA